MPVAGSTDKLGLYNGALFNLKERPLASLTENRESRRTLDAIWNGAIDACLQQGLWNFAMRTAKFTPTVGFTAAFGYANQYIMPSDFVRLGAVCQDEYFNIPLNQYTEEVGCLYADMNPIYVSYVSDAPDYGNNYDRWPQTFVNYVQYYLAVKIGGRVTGEDSDKLQKAMQTALRDARSKDALEQGTKFMPMGNWTRARSAGRRRDRGNRSQLIG